jgi:hypothetical protein
VSNKDFLSHPTFSYGKEKTMFLQRKYWKGTRLLQLVGSPIGLKRHIDEDRKNGFEKIYVYEYKKDCYQGLLHKKETLFPNDSSIVVTYGNLLDHDFVHHPIDSVDFDDCGTITSLIKEGRLEIQKLLDLKIPCISATWTSRNPDYYALYELAHMYDVDDSGRQRDITTRILQKLYPNYNFVQWGYSGTGSSAFSSGGCPMFCITAVLNAA